MKQYADDDTDVTLKNGGGIPAVNSVVDDDKQLARNYMPAMEGWLGERKITVLRGMGYNTFVVRKSVVPKDESIGVSGPVFSLDRMVRYPWKQNVLCDCLIYPNESS